MAIGRTFTIKKNDVKSYGYVSRPRKSGFRSNPGVSTIAAINGRGAYANRSTPRSTLRMNTAARRAHASSALSAAQKRAFVAKMRAGHRKNPLRTGPVRARAEARRPAMPVHHGLGRTRPAPSAMPAPAPKRRRPKAVAAPVKKPRRRRAKAQRRAKSSPLALQRKTAMKSKKARAATKRRHRAAKRSHAPKTATKATRKSRRRKGKHTAKRSVAKAVAPKRKRKARRTTAKRHAKAAAPKRRKSRKKLKANRRRKMKRNYWAERKSPVRAYKAKKHQRAARKGWAGRKPKRGKRKLKANRRRHTTNRRHTANRRTHAVNRRRHRKNGRRSAFRRNGIVGTLVSAAKTGAVLFGGFIGHKLVSNLLRDQVLARLIPAAAPATPPATSGLEVLQPYTGLIASVLTAGIGIPLVNKVVKDESTKKLLMGGMALSLMHNLAVTVLAKAAPTYAGMLSGAEDGTAARISAMYGLGAGASIMPRYAPIGEYFTSGVGEYFQNGVQGVGEYFQSGVQGLGLTAYEAAAGYGSNPDMMQAAAGYGAAEGASNHIDPSGNLDRELTIAEAAAGVGAVQPYEASAGMGNISSLPSASTWIPGTTDGQLWAGTRAISNRQSATEMVPAGVLQTEGGQGVFG